MSQPINNSSSSSSAGGVGVLGLIQAALIILKFIDADWNKAYDIPWVWVFTPVYVGVAFTVLALGAILIGFLIAVIVKDK